MSPAAWPFQIMKDHSRVGMPFLRWAPCGLGSPHHPPTPPLSVASKSSTLVTQAVSSSQLRCQISASQHPTEAPAEWQLCRGRGCRGRQRFGENILEDGLTALDRLDPDDRDLGRKFFPSPPPAPRNPARPLPFWKERAEPWPPPPRHRQPITKGPRLLITHHHGAI